MRSLDLELYLFSGCLDTFLPGTNTRRESALPREGALVYSAVINVNPVFNPSLTMLHKLFGEKHCLHLPVLITSCSGL